MTKLKNELGRTMLEMLGVLAIMGLIMYGAITGIGFGLDMYKINATHTQVEELARGIIDLYSWSRSYAGLSIGIACTNDLLDGCDTDNASAESKFHGSISVGPVEGLDGFFIAYTALPGLACQRLTNMSYTYTEGPRNPDQPSNGANDSNTIYFYHFN